MEDKSSTVSESEIELFKKAQNGDKEAQNSIIVRYLPLVKKIANMYSYQVEKMDFEDLIQEGCLGLLKAIKKYDVNLGFKFSTYAIWWIKGEIGAFIKKHNTSIYLPINVEISISSLVAAYWNIIKRTGIKPTNEELSEETGFTLKKVEKLIKIMALNEMVNINETLDDERELEELLKTDSDLLEDLVMDKLSKEEVKAIILKTNLTEKEKKIMFYRLGLFDDHLYTIQEIADLENKSRQSIWYMSNNACKKLRKNMVLKKYLEK